MQCALSGDKTVATISQTMSKGGVNAAVDSYLSTSHRDAPTPICPLAALGSEVARSGGETKVAATEVLEKLLVTLADSQSGPEGRGDAIVALATMIGAMTMARMVSDTFCPMKSSIARRITCTDKQVHSRLQNASSRRSQEKRNANQDD
jgi:TetR/AcrR family transcriptional regulator, transcriptional repressor for nem operon